MKDTDLMPFGKHKGEKMANVPASWLVWFWDETSKKDFNVLRDEAKEVLYYINCYGIENLKREVKK